MNDISTPDKLRLHQHCLEIVRNRIAGFERQIAELAESVANETKSTAGDKYETARAMLHIEQDQVRRQLAEFRAHLAVLQSIDPQKSASTVLAGSLVQLNDVWYYLSTSLGRLLLDETPVFAISLQSPVGQKLRGKRQDDEISINGPALRIVRLL